jgi:hypothetical protein
MKRERPPAVLVMGILNLVFGGLGLLNSCCGGVSILAMLFWPLPEPVPGAPPQTQGLAIFKPIRDGLLEIPYFKVFSIGGQFFALLTATMLVIAGIGLLRMRKWGRTLSLVYAFAVIAIHTTIVVVQVTYLNKAVAEVMAKMPAPAPGAPNLAGNTTFNNIVAIATGILAVLYSIALIIVMFLPVVRKAFADGPVVVPRAEEDYYDPPPARDDEPRTGEP